MEVKKRRRSVSQLKTFRSCPHAYQLMKLERVPQQESAASIQGSAFHHAAYLWELDRGTNYRVEYLNEYSRLLVETEKKSPRSSWRVWGKGSDVDADIERRRETGLEQIESFVQNFENRYAVEIMPGLPAVEVMFELDIGPCILVGSIDRIDQVGSSIVVNDLKTGTREASPIQLGVYAFAARHTLGISPLVGDFFYAKDGVFSDPYDLSRFTDDYIVEQFTILEKAIENRTLFPSPGPSCFTCPVKQYCKELGFKHGK